MEEGQERNQTCQLEEEAVNSPKMLWELGDPAQTVGDTTYLRYVAAREEVPNKRMNGSGVSAVEERHPKKSISKKFCFQPSDESSEARLKSLSVHEQE